MPNRLWHVYVRLGAAKERWLRSLMPARMKFVHYGWPLSTRVCPCDPDFCDYIRDRRIKGKSIFHLGTGSHHIVGQRNSSDELGNEVLGITVAPDEHDSYIKMIIRNARLANHYKVLFADLYTLAPSALPQFDLVTLFHLGEFSPGGARRLDGDDQVLALFISKLTPGGFLLFYRGSFGFAKTLPHINAAVANNRLSFVEDYKSLAIYRTPNSIDS